MIHYYAPLTDWHNVVCGVILIAALVWAGCESGRYTAKELQAMGGMQMRILITILPWMVLGLSVLIAALQYWSGATVLVSLEIFAVSGISPLAYAASRLVHASKARSAH